MFENDNRSKACRKRTTIESNLKSCLKKAIIWKICTKWAWLYIVLRLSSFIKNVSNTRESNLLLHFFEMLKLLLKSLGAEECLSMNWDLVSIYNQIHS